jgi:hypothetical protein
MKKEYDFSNAERGRFYRPGLKLNLPIYLREDVRKYATDKARAQGIGLEQLVNEILSRHARAEAS